MQPKFLSAGLQLPGKTTFLLAICFSMLFLLLTTASNYLLEGSFGFVSRQLPISSSTIFSSRSYSAPSLKEGSPEPSTTLKSKEVDVAAGTLVNVDWIRLSSVSNYTQRYLTLIAQNGSKACHQIATASAHLFGLPRPRKGEPYISLSCGLTHELTLISFDENGRRRCSGGDYFETDVSGPVWKSRPPITDLGDGSYSILLQVHPRFAGVYNLKVSLMFSNYHGLHRRSEIWFRNETMFNLQIKFHSEKSLPLTMNLPQLSQCKAKDFELDSWTGRWVRSKYNRNCTVNGKGRFLCLDVNEKCEDTWCKGPVGLLESNGWVYSAHCSFRIFTKDAAWKCLNKKWLFFWGDSNHVDTIRNFLNFVLGFENITEVPRRFDTTYARPLDPSQYVRITSMFNGHSNVSLNHEGLFSLNNSSFREQIGSYFSKSSAPDVIIMNSGLHDGMYWRHVHHFVEQGVNNATEFWASLLNRVKGPKPRVIYRTTIATAGWARRAPFNPQKMEVFNNMFVERLKKAHLLWGVVDGFDLTYPWHYDNNCSDGVHYGKPPAPTRWYGQMGHQYFVDLMLVHILLHAICID